MVEYATLEATFGEQKEEKEQWGYRRLRMPRVWINISQFQLSLSGPQYETGRLSSMHDDEARHTFISLRCDHRQQRHSEQRNPRRRRRAVGFREAVRGGLVRGE